MMDSASCAAFALPSIRFAAVIETPNGRFGIINTRTLLPQPDTNAAAPPVDYDGEAADERIARREVRWSPVNGVPW